ncbi:hypothetical protein BC938DRAFT_475897 [Jimgerdemannia flammicorona]|uniref:Stress response protein NST1 n=1 Tax=Jimgerdemannia flammicorona TaxID=994334 RepID=A0A433PMT4_9FUNG|nr:hypothetical protein BC938DRAFT_475897 [Jimgerdemannia flammicorona]
MEGGVPKKDVWWWFMILHSAPNHLNQDPMTEEQRMEEGRRMFQIFAARMFEQRVLQAYREKVAQERQQRLLEELQEEERQKAEREAKKLKEKEKKKDKKRQLKQQKEEERLAKEAAKLAEEAAVKAERERKLEEQRRKQEEERLRKEEERRQKEEERLRKEEEKRRRLKEEKDRELEKERKRKEKEERDRKEREDKLRRDREEKEEKARKEREAKEQKEREDRERREKEKAEKEKERLEKDRAAAAATAATTPKTPDRRKSWQVSGNPTSPAPAPAPAPVVNNNATRNQSPIQRSTNLAPVAAPVPSTDRKQSLGSAIPNPANAPSQTITRSPMWGPVPNVPMGQGQMPHLHAPPQPPQMYNGSPQQQFSTPPLHMPNLSNGMQNPYAQPAPPHLQPPQMPPGVVGSAGSPMNPAATLFHSMGPPTLPLGMGVQQQTMMHMQSPQLTQVRPPPMVSRGFNGMSGPGPLAGSGSPIPTSASSPISTLSILNGTPGMQNSGSNSPASMANQMMGRSLPPLGQAQQVGVGSALLNSQTLNLGTQMGPGANGIGMVGGLGSPHMGPGVSGSMPGPVVPSISTDKTNSPVVAPGAVGISNILPIGHSRRLSQQDQVGVGVSVSSKVITRPNPITPIGKPVSSRRESAGASAPLPGMERSTSTSVSKTASPPPGLSNLADSQPVGSSALDGEPILAEMNGGAGLNGVGMEKGLNGIGMQQQATHSFFSNSFFSASERG